jgi:hypothetical protein
MSPNAGSCGVFGDLTPYLTYAFDVEVLMFLQTGSLTLLFPFLPLHMKERGFTVSQVTFIQ